MKEPVIKPIRIAFTLCVLLVAVPVIYLIWFSTPEIKPITVIPQVDYVSGEVLPKNPQQGDPKVSFGEGSDFERMKKQGNFIDKFPPVQPVLNGSQEDNTKRMVSFMSNNAFRIQLNTPLKKGYIHFRIKTNGNKNGKLFLYLAKDKYTGYSGYIDIKSAEYAGYNTDKTYDLLFDLDKMIIFPWNSNKPAEKLNLIDKFSYFGQANYMSTFWVNNTGSYIEKITLAYDEDR